MTKTRRPFHETIVDAIRRCNPSPSNGEVLNLFRLIEETEIPKGHDEIIAAIDKYFNFPGGRINRVKDSLYKQKEAAPKLITEKNI